MIYIKIKSCQFFPFLKIVSQTKFLDLLFTFQYIMSIFKGKYTDSEAQFFTQRLPQGYSCQEIILQEERAFRQRKLKKIDDIYASDFSLRVLKKKHSQKEIEKNNKQKAQEKKIKNAQQSISSKKVNNNVQSLPKITSAQKIMNEQEKPNQETTKQSSSRRQIKQPKSYEKILQESQKRNKYKKSSPKIVDKTSAVIQDIQHKTNEKNSHKKQSQNPSDQSSEQENQQSKRTPKRQQRMMDQSEQHQNKMNSKQKSLQLNQQGEEMKQNEKGNKKPKWEQKCNQILQKLRVHKSSWPFRRPVDPIAQGVPNYLQVIKEPMDLKTIQKKLKSNSYSTESDFHIDVKKIFKNSYTFNPKQSIFFLHTVDFEKYYQQLVKEYQNYPNHLNMKDKQKSKEEQFNQKEFNKGSSKKQDPSTPKNKRVSRKDQGEKDQNQNDSSPSSINPTQLKKTTSQRKESGKKASIVEKNQNAQQKLIPLVSKVEKTEKTAKKNSILNPPKKDVSISTIQKQKLFYRISLLSNQDLDLMVKLINCDKYNQYQEKQEVQFDLKDMTLEQIIQLKKFVYQKTQETVKNQQNEQSKINSSQHNRIVAEDQIDNQ